MGGRGRLACLNVGRQTDTRGEREGEKDCVCVPVFPPTDRGIERERDIPSLCQRADTLVLHDAVCHKQIKQKP